MWRGRTSTSWSRRGFRPPPCGAAVRAMVEELRRFSPHAQIVRLDHDYAEIDTPDCPFRDIALEHSDLVAVIDPALKEGAMAALGHPSDVETEASVARGDPSCRE